MTEAVFNGLAVALLLTSLFVLRFRGWKRPVVVALYFLFFFALEVVAVHFFLPPGALGPGVAHACLALSVPVLVAAYLVWRHEQRHAESKRESGDV